MLTIFHLTALFFSVAVVIRADTEALAWISGKKPVLQKKSMQQLHRLLWAGLLSLIASGTVLLIPRAEYLLTQPLFVVKLLFVSILVVNAVLIGRLMSTASTCTFASLSSEEKAPLLMSGSISILSWSGAVLTALAVFHIFPF